MEYQDVMLTRKRQIPSFGNWDFYDDQIPVTQYFESARQAGLIRGHFFPEDVALDLFKPPLSPMPYHYRKPKRVSAKQEDKQQHQLQQGKQRRVCDVNAAHHHQAKKSRAPKAVDEDLYKIPPELLYQKPKRRVAVSDFWRRCLGLNCIP